MRRAGLISRFRCILVAVALAILPGVMSYNVMARQQGDIPPTCQYIIIGLTGGPCANWWLWKCWCSPLNYCPDSCEQGTASTFWDDDCGWVTVYESLFCCVNGHPTSPLCYPQP